MMIMLCLVRLIQKSNVYVTLLKPRFNLVGVPPLAKVLKSISNASSNTNPYATKFNLVCVSIKIMITANNSFS